jgi:serine/threonine protein kinase
MSSLPLELLQDFDLTHGGRGRTVLLMTKMDTGHVYAVRKLVGQLRRDRQQPPFPATSGDGFRIAAFLCLAYHGEDVYMLTRWVEGGHLFYYLQQERTFGLERAKVYVAELISICEAMTSQGFGQQDLRPLAISLDWRGFLVYCDFDLYQAGGAMKPEEPISWLENRYLPPEDFTSSESEANHCTGKKDILPRLPGPHIFVASYIDDKV